MTTQEMVDFLKVYTSGKEITQNTDSSILRMLEETAEPDNNEDHLTTCDLIIHRNYLITFCVI